jgi:aspartate/methionine/tyrosine aminotransferase
MKRLGTETAFEVLAHARELERAGRSIIHLEIGEPDFDTPEHISDAAVEALRAGYTHYGPSAGLPEVREAVARHTAAFRGLTVGPEQVVITPGAKPIIFFTLLACVEEGDEVIYPETGFPIYRSVIEFLNARPVPIRIREELGFSLDVDEFARLLTKRTRFVILNTPHNPTGGVLDPEQVRRLGELLRERDLWVLSDEVYSRILYEGEHRSIASEPGMQAKTIILDGHSKTYSMTGWRLGYGVMPEELALHVTRLMTNSNSCTNVFVQRAGMAALEGPQEIVRRRTEEFRRRRDVIVEGLNAIPGLRCARPQGAFYVLPNITGTGVPCRTLARQLLDEAGVAALSGTAFGEFGEGYLRFSYANSVENIREALARIRRFLCR